MKYCLLLVLFALSPNLKAEHQHKKPSGYVVLLNNDTLYGKVVRQGFAKGGAVNLKNESGKRRYYFSEIISYRTGYGVIILRKMENKKGIVYYNEYAVLVPGKIRLLTEEHYDSGRLTIQFEDGQFMDCTENNMEFHIFPELMKCTEFNWKYESVPINDVRKWNNKFKKMMELVRFHNQNCH